MLANDHGVLIVFHRVIEVLLHPFFIINLLLAIALVCLFVFDNSPSVKYFMAGVLGCFWLFSLSPFCSWLAMPLQKSFKTVNQVQTEIKWVVVFGGGHVERVHAPVNQILNDVSIERLLEGVRLYRALPEAKLILSGGGYEKKWNKKWILKSRHKQHTDAAKMAKIIEWFDIPQQDVILETHSWNTADEAIEIKKWIKTDPFYLVTSSVHMARSMALCQKQGLHPIAAPADFLDKDDHRGVLEKFSFSAYNWSKLGMIWHEYLGLISEKIHNRV